MRQPATPDDRAIREALIARLRRRLADHERATVVHELGVREGRARIDVAVVTERLHSYEIKSDRDQRRRLGRQALIYSAVVDRATLVAGTKAVRWATGRVPEWWEIIEAHATARGVKLTRRRHGRRNPDAQARALIELLWRDETLALLEEHGIARGVRGRARAPMWDRAAEALAAETIRRAVIDALHERDYRNGWGSTRRVNL